MSSTTSSAGAAASAKTKGATAGTRPPSRSAWISASFADRLFAWTAKIAALVTLGLLLAIMGSLFSGAWPAIREYGLGFFLRTNGTPYKTNTVAWS